MLLNFDVKQFAGDFCRRLTNSCEFYDPCLREFINNPGWPVAAAVWHTADGAGARYHRPCHSCVKHSVKLRGKMPVLSAIMQLLWFGLKCLVNLISDVFRVYLCSVKCMLCIICFWMLRIICFRLSIGNIVERTELGIIVAKPSYKQILNFVI